MYQYWGWMQVDENCNNKMQYSPTRNAAFESVGSTLNLDDFM